MSLPNRLDRISVLCSERHLATPWDIRQKFLSQEIVNKYGGRRDWLRTLVGKGWSEVRSHTDDTQMAEIVLRSLLRSRAMGFVLESAMEDIAAGFVEWLTNPQEVIVHRAMRASRGRPGSRQAFTGLSQGW